FKMLVNEVLWKTSFGEIHQSLAVQSAGRLRRPQLGLKTLSDAPVSTVGPRTMLSGYVLRLIEGQHGDLVPPILEAPGPGGDADPVLSTADTFQPLLRTASAHVLQRIATILLARGLRIDILLRPFSFAPVSVTFLEFWREKGFPVD